MTSTTEADVNTASLTNGSSLSSTGTLGSWVVTTDLMTRARAGDGDAPVRHLGETESDPATLLERMESWRRLC